MKPKVTASDSPAAVSDPPHELVARDARVGRRRRRRHRREGRLELVEAVVAADFLDEIDLAQQIDAEGRHDRRPSRRLSATTSSPSARRIRTTSASRHGEAEQRGRAAARRRWIGLGAAGAGIAIDDRTDRCGRRRSARISASARWSATTGALMSAPRSNRDEASVFRPSRLLVRRTEAGLKYALSNATVRVAAETSDRRAAHHAGDRLRRVAVGDDQHVRFERAVRRRRAW